MNTNPDVDLPDESKNAPKGKVSESIDKDTHSHMPISSSSENKQYSLPGDKGGEVNMEALILEDDVVRAGGFGARDDISSFLPVASDSTDFEATLRDARDYEEPQDGTRKPGLGWRETKDTK